MSETTAHLRDTIRAGDCPDCEVFLDRLIADLEAAEAEVARLAVLLRDADARFGVLMGPAPVDPFRIAQEGRAAIRAALAEGGQHD